MVPSHYLNQCWLIIKSSGSHLKAISQEIPKPSITKIVFTYLKLHSNELKTVDLRCLVALQLMSTLMSLAPSAVWYKTKFGSHTKIVFTYLKLHSKELKTVDLRCLVALQLMSTLMSLAPSAVWYKTKFGSQNMATKFCNHLCIFIFLYENFFIEIWQCWKNRRENNGMEEIGLVTPTPRCSQICTLMHCIVISNGSLPIVCSKIQLNWANGWPAMFYTGHYLM